MQKNTFLSYDEALASACEYAARAAQRQGRSVLLVQDFSAIAQAKRYLASVSGGLGVQVETLSSWVSDLWELWGDARTPVAHVQRVMFAHRALYERACEQAGGAAVQAFPESDGMARLITQLLRKDAPFFDAEVAGFSRGLRAFAEGLDAHADGAVPDSAAPAAFAASAAGGADAVAVADGDMFSEFAGRTTYSGDAASDAGLSGAEEELLTLVRRCLALEKEAGVIEPALACALLARGGRMQQLSVALWNVVPSSSEELLLASAAELAVFELEACERACAPRNSELSQLSSVLYHPKYEQPVAARGAVRFALPMGAYASPALLAQEVQRLAQQGNRRIALSCADPTQLFEQMAPRLLSRGMACRATVSVALAQTAFGVAWVALLRFLQDANHHNVALISDYALSAFSFMGAQAAAAADASLRQWRGLTCDDAFRVVSGQSARDAEAVAASGADGAGAAAAGPEDEGAVDAAAGRAETKHSAQRDFVQAVMQGCYEDALMCQRAWVARQMGWSEAFRAMQLLAIDIALDIQRAARLLGLPQELALQVFASLSTPLRLRVGAEGIDYAVCARTACQEGQSDAALFAEEALEAQKAAAAGAKCAQPEEDVVEVTLLSLYELGKREPAAFDACIIANLSAEDYPLDNDEQAEDGLLKKLSCYQPSRKVEQLRTAFSCALAAAKNSIVVHRVLKDEKTDDVRPSALFDELVDCYRADPQNSKELNELWGVPQVLEPFVASRGEEAMTCNSAVGVYGSEGGVAGDARDDAPGSASGVAGDTQDAAPGGMLGADLGSVGGAAGEHHLPCGFSLCAEKASLVAPTTREARTGRAPHFSASAIEAYLECPFKWFTQRRMNVTALDARMDARARGTFAHALLQDFHANLMQSGDVRVTPQNFAQVSLLFTELFYQHLEAEKQSGRPDAYFPTNNREMLEVDRFRKTLEEFIAWEADFLPAYHPAAGEFSFGLDEETLYAGCSLVGSVDRVDVDDAGHAVILDYKGSAGAQYRFRAKEDEAGARKAGAAGTAGTGAGAAGAATAGATAAGAHTGTATEANASALLADALPEKVQALIYAQVIRRKTGLIPVGALYVSYGATHGCAGLYDARVLDPQRDLLGASAQYCETTAFLDELDRVEEAIAARLEQLRSGNIDPRPSESACKYCSLAAICAQLRAGREVR